MSKEVEVKDVLEKKKFQMEFKKLVESFPGYSLPEILYSYFRTFSSPAELYSTPGVDLVARIEEVQIIEKDER